MRRAIIPALVCALLFVRSAVPPIGGAVLAAEPGVRPSSDVYKDWGIICDNGLTCTTRTVAEDKESQITLVREAGAAGRLSLQLDGLPNSRSRTLRIDGAAVALAGRAWTFAAGDVGATARSSDPATVRGLLIALGQGHRLSLGRGKPLSLNGLSAALLRMDERQGRIGTVTALARPGDRPAAAVPPPPPLPVVRAVVTRERLTAAERGALLARYRDRITAARESTDCDPQVSDLDSAVHALGPDRAVIITMCLAAAYNPSYIVLVIGRRSDMLEQFTAPDTLAGPGPHELRTSFEMAEFDPASASLSSYGKGSPMAYTGFGSTWVWDGRRFVLTEANESLIEAMTPGDWVTTYRTR
ncbi:DUF1176 domain-containing protein [Novosphingobium flavum]|uniref:DUF1176 domain-containing protein n=1 Tax=Novosphingobium aerophilum TaxID=2839843 RepID=UPI00163B5AA0|nr:DUF1176 domain-containing protein [Novosphingobium aerophilum]MBC2661185.1 DUF1176 domain-containing protein [Novosphingobium aerophilum]